MSGSLILTRRLNWPSRWLFEDRDYLKIGFLGFTFL